MEDERIDRVLRGIGAAPVPDGLENRVLRRIAQREAMRSTGRAGRGLLWGGAVAAAMVALAVGLHFGLHRGRGVVGPALRVQAIAVPVPPALRPDLRPVAVRRGKVRRRPVTARLVSYPAPEAPLTEQERLLVEISRANHPEVVDALNPVLRAQVEERSKEEFNVFLGNTSSGGTK